MVEIGDGDDVGTNGRTGVEQRHRVPATGDRQEISGDRELFDRTSDRILAPPRFRRTGHTAKIVVHRLSRIPVEHSFGGPLGTLIAGLGMGAFYVALIWINTLLGVFLTPLFIIPLTWIQDALKARKASAQVA